jgi:hypothetical protein
MEYKIKATKDDGTVYYIYDGAIFDSVEKANSECEGCNKQWPEIVGVVMTARERWKMLWRTQRIIRREKLKCHRDVILIGTGILCIPHEIGEPYRVDPTTISFNFNEAIHKFHNVDIRPFQQVKLAFNDFAILKTPIGLPDIHGYSDKTNWWDRRSENLQCGNGIAPYKRKRKRAKLLKAKHKKNK